MSSSAKFRSSNARQRRKRAFLFLLVTLFLFTTICIALVDWRIRPMIQTYGSNQSVTAATRSVNDAVGKVLSHTVVKYEELANVSKDNEGDIASIDMNTTNLNLLKSSISEAVLQELDNQAVQKVEIPLGSLVGGLMTGRGPNIRIKVPMNSTVETSFQNLFESAGINQTRHEITITVKVSIYTVIQGENTATEVQTGFTVAETILVGKVPQWMVNGNASNTVSK